MCYNCGCGLPNDDMGDPDNITNDTFKQISEESGKDIKDVKSEMYTWLKNELNGQHTDHEYFDEAFEKASEAWGQSVEDAKRETYDLLSKEM